MPNMIDDLAPLNRSHSLRHLRFGWWALLCFLVLGFVLEMLHALKIGWYLNVENEARRLTWTLAHAHGTLFAVLNLVFGLSLTIVPFSRRNLVLASRSLIAATVLLPAGFFLGGVFSIAGDPGIGIVLVPVGALLVTLAVLLAARASSAAGDAPSGPITGEGKQADRKRRR
jgi:hypothetical protein